MRVFGADEQSDLGVDVLRYVQLAQLVADEESSVVDAELSVIFVSEATIAELHERFLGGSGPTDVLAFPIDEELPPGGRRPDQGGRGPSPPAEPSDPPMVVGDVLVCPAVARRQAEAAGHDLDSELSLLVVHGVLHLFQYDHAEPDEATVMRRREQELLARFRAGGGAGSDHPVPPAAREVGR